MPEHRIRLRGAWDRIDPAEPGLATRVDLPTSWSVGFCSRPFRLTRRFGRPGFDPATKVVALELVDVPGLQVIQLNGRSLGWPPERPGQIVLGDALLPRNSLELEVDPADFLPGVPWGSIALVIVGREG